MIYGIPIPGRFDGKKINRLPRERWIYPIPIQGRYRGKKVYRFPRLILAGKPLIVSREEGRKLSSRGLPEDQTVGRRTLKKQEFRKKIGRPKKYATHADRMRAYRARKAAREGRIYGQRFSRHKPKLKPLKDSGEGRGS